MAVFARHRVAELNLYGIRGFPTSPDSAENAVVGNEGVVRSSLFMGGDSTPSQVIVQNAGGTFRLTGQLMKEEFYRGGPVLHLLLQNLNRGTESKVTEAGP